MPDETAGLPSPFNGAVECGLRAMVLLAAAKTGCDLRRLVIYDYLLVHSGDVPGEVIAALAGRAPPDSLHPATPHRSGELLVRRATLAAGLQLLMRKGLAAPKYGADGITYVATGLTTPFLGVLESDYIHSLRQRGEWVVGVFSRMTDDELSGFASQHLRDWGGEFVNESLLRGHKS
jgi:hypothetical protein